MGLTRAEQETILRWDEEEQVVHVYSASPKTWRKCARLGLTPVKETRLRTGEPSGKFYRVPFADFRWGLKAKSTAPRRGNPDALRRAREARTSPAAAAV